MGWTNIRYCFLVDRMSTNERYRGVCSEMRYMPAGTFWLLAEKSNGILTVTDCACAAGPEIATPSESVRAAQVRMDNVRNMTNLLDDPAACATPTAAWI